jgi:ABC-2 type transport system permease protein
MRIKGHTSMSNVWLIARREYIERVRTRGFMLTTIMIPLIMGGFVFGSVFLGSKASNDVHIAVVSSDTRLALDLQDELQREQRQRDDSEIEMEHHPTSSTRQAKQPNIIVDAIDPGPNTRQRLDKQLDDDELDGYLWITPAEGPGGRPKFAYTPRASGQNTVKNMLGSAMQKVLMRGQLSHHGVIASDADTMLQPVEIVAAHEAHNDDRESAEISVTVLFFLMYMVIMLYGMNVARSIIEEKTSRIFEVLLATVRPEAMMAGKIIGVGSVGLTQVGIWLAAALVAAGTSVAVNLGGDSIHMALTGEQVIFFFVYFILGYLFYASIAAALGSMTNSEQELQQLNMFLVLPLVVCFVALGTVLLTPDVPISRVLALIPPFTPLLMYMRVSLGHPLKIEIAASIVLMLVSIAGIIWVTSRIYRVGVLMYGKRPSIPEMLKWLKYS